MDAGIQSKLVRFLEAGGRILLFGEVPQFDMEGNQCTLLADALGVWWQAKSVIARSTIYP